DAENKGLNSELYYILGAATVLYLFSVWEHLPGITPSHYSDVMSVFFRDGIGRGTHGIPYYDYVFEYPVLVGLAVYLCSSVRLVVPGFNEAMMYYSLAMDAILYASTMAAIMYLYRLLTLVKGDVGRVWKCFLVAPSFIMFTPYNWDMMAVAFSTASLYYYLSGDKGKADLCLGLGIGAKLYPVLLILVYILEERDWPSRLRRFFTPLLVFAALNLPFIAADFHTWFETWLYHARWGIEDSWLIFLFDQMDMKAHYAALAVLLYLLYKGLLESSKRSYPSREGRVIHRGFLVSVAWLFGNYVVTPQMALILLPFYVLIPIIPVAAIYAAEILNALIIVLWFTPELNLGNPLVRSSPVQWAAALRQAIWLSLYVYTLYPERTKTWMRKLFQRVGE
ncbi:MAG: glycosyltransferase 87 family protein, partial [Candidatus Bathyarchaeia archaeon]